MTVETIADRPVKILFLQLRRLGDLILTTPAIAALREQVPGAEVSLAIAQGAAPLLPALDGLHRAIVAGAGSLAWAQVRRGDFDCIIDLTSNDRSAWLTALSGTKRRIVSDRLRRQSKVRAFFYNEFVDCAMNRMHTADYYLALLRPLGVHGAEAAPRLFLPAARVKAADQIIAREISRAPFVIFHPGSARAEKFWEPSRWAEAIAALPAPLVPVLTGGNGALEKQHLAEVRSCLQVPIVDLSGWLDLLTLAALLQRARLLVTVDSAPMHLAAALRTPQVDLFGPTNPFHWRPRHSPVAILLGPNPKPLTDFDFKTPKFPMADISTAAVIDAMRSVLSAPTASAV